MDVPPAAWLTSSQRAEPNDFHGNVFGFLRDKSFQARNPFAPVAKPPFNRKQYGFTIGGPLDKDRTFFFFAFEQRRRDESGFFTSNVAQGLTGSVTVGAPLLPFTQTFTNLTPQQVGYINGLIGTGNAAAIGAAVQYAYLASSGGNTALTGTNPLLSTGGVIPAGQAVGARFFLTGAPVPSGTTNSQGQFIAFRPLNNLQKVFPITDRTTFNSIRLDHLITQAINCPCALATTPARSRAFRSSRKISRWARTISRAPVFRY